MDQFSAMQSFRRVVDLGSFSAAASQAGGLAYRPVTPGKAA
ncbi:hypothetical protein N7645_22740 [Pseudomonas juntendi]|nr:hypothetical protein [Pseudomonas juntendi]MDG9921149.1 hypothetical protein [Pseudomonas juntendi]MDH0509123.1 hypothetical protein [Pseudomonas juntendi]MDH1046194.1 hypothetical protein [Pseudomonas juntendi]